MLTIESINRYIGLSLSRGNSFLYIPPHDLLRSYISHYTISFPTPLLMSNEYTVLPSASVALCIFVSNGRIISSLAGPNTKADKVGAYANKMNLLLLIKFRAGGLSSFYNINQFELTDASFALGDIDKILTQTIEDELIKSESIEDLVEALDRIFLTRLTNNRNNKSISVSEIMRVIFERHGNINIRELAASFYYSEKHIGRLFLNYIGTTPKTFSRIVRISYVLHLLQSNPAHIADIAMQAGFFDQPHLIHDFKTICGSTPQEYKQNMSIFYNDYF